MYEEGKNIIYFSTCRNIVSGLQGERSKGAETAGFGL